MKDQISSDLAQFNEPISIQAMREFFRSDEYASCIVEFKIKDNRIESFPHKELKNSFLIQWHDTVYRTLVKLAKKRGLPDCTFFVCCSDGFDRHMPYPLFVMEKHRETKGQIMFPDIFNLRGDYKFAPVRKWDQKKDLMVWRGSTGESTHSRVKLCKLSTKHPSHLDAGFTFAYAGDVEAHEPLLKQYGKERLPYEELVLSKYLLWVDGFNASFSDSGWRLFSNSVTIKPDSPRIQWYYGALEPHIHFVPIKADLSNLIETIDWLRSHDAEAQKIAKNARKFAEEGITRKKSRDYFHSLLWAYSKLEFKE